MKGTPFDLIIGLPSLERLQACIDLGKQHVQVTVGKTTVKLGLNMDVERVSQSGTSTESEDFTSDSEAVPDSSTTSENNFVLATLDREPFEPDLGLIKTPDSDMDEAGEGLDGLPHRSEEEPERLHLALLTGKLRHLGPEAREDIIKSIENSGIAAWSLDDLRPADVPVTHSFELEDPSPIKYASRRLPPRHNGVVREELDKMLEAGIITPSVSAWSFPIVIASKKDGKPRFCVDYRTLNRRMKADRWPLLKIEEIFDDLEGSAIFTTLELFSGYWHVQMADKCKEMTTFVCRFGTFQFEVMPFGLMNAPSTFQRMMDQLFQGLSFARVYLDDVVVFSKSAEEHISHLLQVFKVIAMSGLKLKISKCSFAQSQTRLLGHIISREGVPVDLEKINVIRGEREPSTTKELRSFLGLASYYRRFIPKFAEISAPLHEATSTKRDYKWTDEMQKAFERLKFKLTSPPVLAFPDFDQPFVVETDASSVAVGAVLTQRKEDKRVQPIQYASRTMTSAERNYSACEREALALIFALKKFRVYLLSTQRFTLITDHQALQYAFKKKDIHGRLARWMEFLAEYEFEVKYRPGGKNSATDFLSLLKKEDMDEVDPVDEGGLVCSVEARLSEEADLEPHLIDILKYLSSIEMTELDARRRRLNRRNAKRFMACNNRLFRRTNSGLRAIPPIEARKKIVRAFHDEIGHWDLETTKRFVLDRYWWPTVHRDVNGYVRGCEGCQRASPIPKYKTTLRFPMTSLFDTYSVDFAGPLPRTPTGEKYILVAVEHLTGWPIARATATSTAEEVLKFVKEEIIHCFGLPRVVVSDNATCFTASVLESFMARNGITWKTVLAYAPMSNGRAERMIGTLKKAIRKVLLGSAPSAVNWDAALHRVLYGYRRRKIAVGLSPFELLTEYYQG